MAGLLATLVRQIIKQAGDDTKDGEGVSTWLFIGQASTSALFDVYSILVQNWVFIVTDSCLLVSAVVGH